jgi:heptosyltransferase-2
MSEPNGVLVVAPNWLGDAVMALPAIADVRRAFSSARLIVAARRSVADLYRLSPVVDEVATLQWGGRWWRRRQLAMDAAQLQDVEADVAVLLPNSFAAAWLIKRAAIPERWGYEADMRRPLLTRVVKRPKGALHQGAYYQLLTEMLGMARGPLAPTLTIPERATAAAHDLLRSRGWDSASPVVVLAPGAAYGGAKRWVPRYVGQLATALVRRRNATCVLVGSRADAPTVRDAMAAIDRSAASRTIDLTGQTTLEVLAAVQGLAKACVSNDSGAMHLAAAVGTPLVALFGPTNERETAPLPRPGSVAEVLTNPVWCRPCLLRECPLDHRCMTGIPPERVLGSIERMLS